MLQTLTVHGALDLLRSGEIRATELTAAILERIYAVNNEVKAYLTLTPEEVLDQAARAEELIAGARASGELDALPP